MSSEDDDEPAEVTIPHVPTLKSGSIRITRLQTLQWLNQREFWASGQWNLLFTIILWGAFTVQMVLRANVEGSFGVHETLVQHMQHIAAHPSQSRVPLRLPEEKPVPCRCSCGSQKLDYPPSPCENGEILDFTGYLPPAAKAKLLEHACTDMSKPLMEFSSALGPNISSMTCGEWVNYTMPDDVERGQSLMCSAESFEAYLLSRSTLPEFVNDTLNNFLYRARDFKAPQWRCPGTCNVCKESLSDGAPALVWGGIGTENDVMLWVEHGLLPDIFGGGIEAPYAHQAGLVQQRNLIIGGIRARQLRAQAPFECRVTEGLRAEYKPHCRSPEPATTYPVNAHIDVTDPDLKLATTPATSSDAKAPLGAFDVHFDVERPAADAIKLATKLRRSKWLDGGRALVLQALVLNAEARVYALLDVFFTFRFDGAVDKHISARVFPAVDATLDWMDHIPELVFIVLILALLRQEVWQFCFMIWNGEGKLYFKSIWNLVDWISILLGAGIVVYYYFMKVILGDLTNMIVELPRSPLPTTVVVDDYHKQWGNVLDEARKVVYWKEYYVFVMFLYSTVITLRFLKGFLTQQKLAMIQHSMGDAFWDVFHFTIIFLLLFVNFAVGGRVLFGEELDAWSTYPKAASTTAQMLMGSFHFDEMYELLPISSTIWFWLFLVCMTFLFLQVLTALMVDHFRTFRGTVGKTDSIFFDIHQGFREFWWRLQWRWENIKDQEFLAAISNPYEGLTEGLMENAVIPEDMQAMAQDSSLGIRLALIMQDNISLEGYKEDEKNNSDPRVEWVTSLELRKLGCDPMTAEHVMEECDDNIRLHDMLEREANPSEIQQIRAFRKLLQTHRETLEAQCKNIESGVEEEKYALEEDLDRFHHSVLEASMGLAELRVTKVDSLALPPPKLKFTGTTLRDNYPRWIGKQPPRMGTAPVPGRGGLSRTVPADSEGLALVDRLPEPSPAHPAIANSIAHAGGDMPAPPAIDNGTELPAITYSNELQ